MPNLISKKLSVTVGIPVYNEQRTIKNIITDVLNQTNQHYVLDQIIILSDGSTDKTISEAKLINNSRIKIVEGTIRKGKPSRMNQLFSMAHSDVVIVLDADIRLHTHKTIDELITPILQNNTVQLTSGHGVSNPTRTLTQQIALAGHSIWNSCKFDSDAQELLLCDGSLRAFGKNLYARLRFPNSSADEAFSFLACKQYGYDFRFVKNSVYTYTLPSTLRDYIRQVRRYILSPEIQKDQFSKEVLSVEFSVPIRTKLRAFISYAVRNPFPTLLYGAVTVYARILNRFHKDTSSRWEIISTSKDNSITKKRIVISNYDDIHNPYYAGGGARILQRVANYLSTTYSVTVLTGNYPGAVSGEIDGVRYIRLGSSRWGPYLGQLLFPTLIVWYALRNTADLWLENLTPPFSTSFLPLISKKPVIGMVHMLPGKDMYRKYKVPMHLWERWGLLHYRYFIVVNQQHMKQIKTVNPQADITYIPNGIDLNQYAQKLRKKHLLFLGRIEVDQKGLDLLISAYAKSNSSLPLVIAGTGDSSNLHKLSELIRHHHLTSRVRLVGRVEGAAKQRLIADSAAMIVSSRFETFPLTVLEALANKKLLLGFDIAGLQWVPQEVMVKTPPFNTDEFARNIAAVSEHASKTKTIVDRGFRFVQSYSMDACLSAYRKKIETLISL